METKHTPLPWTFRDIGTARRDDGLGYIEGPDGIEIDHHGSNRKSKEENLANAELKITAVNSHNSLVEALKENMKLIEVLVSMHIVDGGGLVESALANARAVLAPFKKAAMVEKKT